jgi:ATP-dependent DNA helicase RecG
MPSGAEALLRELEDLIRRQLCWIEPARLRQWERRASQSGSPLLAASAGSLAAMLADVTDLRARREVGAAVLKAVAQLRTKLGTSAPAAQQSTSTLDRRVVLPPDDAHERAEQLTNKGAAGTARGNAREHMRARPATATDTPNADSLSTNDHHPSTISAPLHKRKERAQPVTSSLALTTPLGEIPGIGPSYAKALDKAGWTQARDLLFHFPRRYDDYSNLLPIAALRPGMDVTLRVQVVHVDVVGGHSKARRVVVVFRDATGEITAVWFKQDWIAKNIKTGQLLYVSGRVEVFNGKLQFSSPEYEPADGEKETLHTGRLAPVYALTSGITNRWLRGKVKYIVDRLAPQLVDVLPPTVRQRWDLPAYPRAVAQAHFPDDADWRDRARHRIAFDEAFVRQLALQRRKVDWKDGQPGALMHFSPEIRASFAASLPFGLTQAQQRVSGEILADLASGTPMARLLQGDVGSGKTVVASLAAYAAWCNGFQTALMAPTEILAEQHLKTVTALFSLQPDLRVELLTGSTSASQKRAVGNRLATLQTHVVVGTHAVIEGYVTFARLGLAIIDEQHRFGVLQRGKLQQKGFNPHLLVMSATPIPRTLERARYADLDVSIIDELPPGRTPIKTAIVLPDRRESAYAFVRKQVAEGQQVFVICPLVEESEAVEARAATSEYERLRRDVFPDLRLGLLHGRMRPTEKDRVMRAFRDQEHDVLVSTTVIEVGIDVPNATIMMIEGAERFGLSQLHQLRGRVGRGAHQSYCMLLPSEHLEEATRRLRIVEGTNDGFRLAEEDLKLRGPGEFYGVRQSGLDLFLDTSTIAEAHEAAMELLAIDPRLELPAHRDLAALVAAAQTRLVEGD